tara:strand:+ start:1897 stop:2241 length:345 start_codon:yes stop_codon:yes gene_type:complete
MSDGVNLFYNTIEEKRKILQEVNIELVDDSFLEKVIYSVDDSMYQFGLTIIDTHSFNIPVQLNKDEYFILYHIDEDKSTVIGNKMEKKYLEDFFPEIFKIENRNDVINDIINGG